MPKPKCKNNSCVPKKTRSGMWFCAKCDYSTLHGLEFGTRGIWHMPASENTKAKDMKAVVLEQTKEGVLYIFTKDPILKGAKNLTYRTATIFPSDFTPDKANV